MNLTVKIVHVNIRTLPFNIYTNKQLYFKENTLRFCSCLNFFKAISRTGLNDQEKSKFFALNQSQNPEFQVGARIYFMDENPETVHPLTRFVCKFFSFPVFTFGNCLLLELVTGRTTDPC